MPFVYQYPLDNYAASVTPSVSSGTINATNPIANLANGNPALPCKFTTTSCRLVWDMGSAVRVELPVLVHTNWSSGTAKIEAHTADSWGAPAFSADFTVTAADQDGLRENPWLDLRTVAAGGVGPATAYRYWSLVIASNAAAITLGEIWLGGTYRYLASTFLYDGIALSTGQEAIVHRTNMGVALAYGRGTRDEMVSGQLFVGTTDRQSIQSFLRACGFRAQPSIVIVDTARNHALMARSLSATLERNVLGPAADRIGLSFEHLSRGQAW